MASVSILGTARAAPRRLLFPGPVRHFSSYLVAPKDLDAALRQKVGSGDTAEPRVVPLCATWFMPNEAEGRTGRAAFVERRIPKARFFDLDRVIDKHSPYPHMLPGPKKFAEAMAQIGIRFDDTVVVYDSVELGMFSAPRVAWTLRVFGHPRVHILNDFRLWVEQGLPVESGSMYPSDCCTYPIPEVDLDPKVASFDEVREAALNHNKDGAEGVQVLDARAPGRWTGEDAEPREGLSSGHMPGSINIPFQEVLDPKTKAFLPPEALRALFEKKGVDPTRPIISSCGTGVTACVLETALEVAGYGDPAKRKVYDGSWT